MDTAAPKDWYAAMCDFQNLYAAHKAARKGKRCKSDVIEFEMNLAENLTRLQRALTDRTFRLQGYYHFMVYEPKERSIYAPRYADRVVQHCLCDNILRPVLEPRLIHDNAACRVGKGTHFALDRLTGFLRSHYKKHGAGGYFLKCDIRKYFDSISHAALKKLLGKVFPGPPGCRPKCLPLFRLLEEIVDSYETTPGFGLPLGNQTSQWFALYYLDKVDRLVKERLGIKYYTRYMDDFVLVHHDKTYLQKCLGEIRALCRDELQLELNQKTQIFPIRNGVDYLGWHVYLTETGKVVRKLRRSNKQAMFRRFHRLQKAYAQERMDFAAVKRSMASTKGHLMHGNTYLLRRRIERGTVFTHGG
jgi:hypothetical protein